jgi:protein TonB
MNRSLLPALLLALLLHALLAWVELDFFKGPVPGKVLAKTLTIDIFGPQPAQKPLTVKHSSIVAKEPILKKEIKKPPKAKPRVRPKRKVRQGIQAEESIAEDRPPKKERTFAPLSPVARAAIKTEEIFLGQDNSFVPDTVDIPMALPEMRDTPDSPYHAPITHALPMYQKNTPPRYPFIARRRGYQGKVLLEVLVKRDGSAGSIRLARSSGYEVLDRAAIKGVKTWLFHPARRGDDLVEMWVEIPIRFQLK